MTKKKKRIKIRCTAPDISTHVRKTPSLVEKQRKKEKKYRDPLIKY